MRGQHIILEGDRATSEPAIVAHIDAASCGVPCPYHDGIPHAPCCELDRAAPVAPSQAELDAELRKLAVDYVRRLGWQL